MRHLVRSALALAVVLGAAACASAPTRMYRVMGPESFYGAAQAESGREWMNRRGIQNYVVYGSDSISFKYGSDAVQTMSYAEFDAFARARLAGYTIATARRPNTQSSDGAVPQAVVYFGEDGKFHQWSPSGPSSAALQTGQWWFEDVPEADLARARGLGIDPPRRVICFDVERRNALPVCSPIYDQISGIHSKQPGDVFGLATGKIPGLMTPEYPSEWPDGSPLFPERASHD